MLIGLNLRSEFECVCPAPGLIVWMHWLGRPSVTINRLWGFDLSACTDPAPEEPELENLGSGSGPGTAERDPGPLDCKVQDHLEMVGSP